MKNIAEIENNLAQFNGSENFYRHSLNRRVVFTDGAKYVADACDAYWLLDEIVIANMSNYAVRHEEFQVWTLKLYDHGPKAAVKSLRFEATLACADGNGNIVFSKHIPFTDFLLPKIELWFKNNTIFLPRRGSRSRGSRVGSLRGFQKRTSVRPPLQSIGSSGRGKG
jgi:hypothetical protein